jgi:hypothetical protein
VGIAVSKKKRMTERQWLAYGVSWVVEFERTTEPHPMLVHLQGKVSHRKLRLFACACCRRIECLMERSDYLVELAERYADGEATPEELADERLDSAPDDENYKDGEPYWYNEFDEIDAADYAAHELTNTDAEDSALTVSATTCDAATAVSSDPDHFGKELAAHAELIRDIFGNPFRKVKFSKTWRTSTAVALARQMYDARDFSAMPILGDALQDADCDNEDILNHCRGSGPHVRGC